MGELLETYLAAMRPVLPAVPLPLSTEKPLAINTGLGGLSKRRSLFCAIKQESFSKLEEELAGRLIAYTNGSVIQDAGSATTSCEIPALGCTVSCRLSFSACSITAETAGFHLAVDLLAENSPTCPVAFACDSRSVAAWASWYDMTIVIAREQNDDTETRRTRRVFRVLFSRYNYRRDLRAALLAMAKPEQIGFGTQLLVTKLNVLLTSGADISLNGVLSQVGVYGNEQEGALTKEAHHPAVYVCRAAVASHFSRLTLRRLLLLCHPDYCVARVKPPTRPPVQGFTKRNRSLPL
ncbi:hypothetical protein HPB51_027081 [Rhipicephalus microplus]|uniref:Tick transposon n=1 Tax=Rhipicephalus microplus TaxID=6941 RepID=A0A9J6D160_RHIMP|nr:hypothetical protein HPB51_027081 [Rhipicephalus microplus]